MFEDRQFRILIAGDFGGTAASHNCIRVDRDNIDDVVQQLRVSIDLSRLNLSIGEMEDFHPDRIYARVEAFQDLEREALPVAPAVVAAPVEAAASGNLLDDIMKAQEPQPVAKPKPVTVEDAADLQGFISRITAGHLVSPPNPNATARVSRRDELAARLMRAILHHPRFQAIEAAWRALLMLVQELDEGNDLAIYILDLTLPEVLRDLDAVRKTLKQAGKWALILGNFSFGQSDGDIQNLEKLGELCQFLRAPMIAESRPPGDDTSASSWRQFRESEAAKWIGLALPRFLLRLPYGKSTLPLESFPFEEMPLSEHSAYLWGNPAFLCGMLLGRSFLDTGWDLSNLHRQMDNLPIHIYREDGETVAKPTAEVLMTEEDAYELMDKGFMPVASLKNQGAALIVRFQSAADPSAPLPIS